MYIPQPCESLNCPGMLCRISLPWNRETSTSTAQSYGTAKGRSPSVGKIPVGVVAVEGCARNM